MNAGRLKSLTLIATLALAFPVPAALAQTSDSGPKQDMKNAGSRYQKCDDKRGPRR